MLFLWLSFIRKGIISLLNLFQFFIRIMPTMILMSGWSSFRAHLREHVVRWILMVLMIGCDCSRRCSLRHLRIDTALIVLMLCDATRPVRISGWMKMAVWETTVLIRMMIHHVAVRCKVGCSLAICRCRESVRVVRIIIGSCHVLLQSSLLQIYFEGPFLSSFRIFLHTRILDHLLFMQLLLFISFLFNTTLRAGLDLRRLREGH